MSALETRLTILGIDETAKAFASVEAKIKALSRTVHSASAGIGGTTGQAAQASATSRAVGQAAGSMGMIASAARAAAGFAIAYGGAIAVKEAAKAVAARQHEIVRMAVSGMKPDEIAEATMHAANLVAKMPNIGATEAMHMLRNARSIVGTYEDAALVAEQMLKLRTLAQLARPGQDVSEDMDQLIKGLEIKGVTQNPKQFKEYMEGIAKGINVFGDTLKPYQYYEMFKYGRQATAGLSEKFILSTAPTLAQELGGSSFGKAVSAFNQLIVAGVGKKGAFQELSRIGLMEKSALAGVGGTSDAQVKAGHTVKGWQVAQSDPNQWVKEFLLPALDKVGIKDRADVMRELGTLFQNQMAGQMVSLLATQQGRIDKDTALYNGAPGLSAADRALREDPSLAWAALENATGGLVATFGELIGAGHGFAGMMTSMAQSEASLSALIERMMHDKHPLEEIWPGHITPDHIPPAERHDAEKERQVKYDEWYKDKRHSLIGEFDAAASEKQNAAEAKGRGDEDTSPAYKAEQEARERAADDRIQELRARAVELKTTWEMDVGQRANAELAYRNSLAIAGYPNAMPAPGEPARAAAGASFGDSRRPADTIDRLTERARNEASVHVDGEATLEIPPITINVNASPELQATVAAAAAAAKSITIPLKGATGRMDSDAAPHRYHSPH